ncbi:hypothetical protein [Streptomyces coeruleorubidus]|nr:hypothetical protein [Streptomyces coeruleorubidus]GGT85621.1 hypothetical protein GCM10010256_52160 [Streptomyces coeruleorubidus]
MDLSKPAPESGPLAFKGYMATALLYPDRVEFKRSPIARLGGNRSGTVLLADVLKVHQVAPTRLVNGHVHLMTAEDPGALRSLSMTPKQQPAGNPRTILFTWQQRDTYTKFVAAVEAALGEQPNL